MPVEPPQNAPPYQKILWSDLKPERKLGEGGFGIVYYGTYRNTTPVALKQVKGGLAFGQNEEYEREIEIMAKLSSPYVVRFYGVCIVKAMIVMEYVSNGSLWDVLHSDDCPTWKGRYRIGLDITEGLYYLHGENIIHADLKSLNVLITEDFRAKITDFGLAKIKAGHAKNATTLVGPDQGNVGTTRWMPPELFEVDARTSKESDAYSYGMILWELGARKIPFEDISNNMQIPIAVKNGRRETITSDTPPKMAALTRCCWERSPTARPTMQKAKQELTQEFNSYKFK